MAEITLVPVNDIDRIWPEVAEHFRKACERSPNLKLSWLYMMVRNGNAILFRVGTDASFIGEFIDDDGVEKFKVHALGGGNMRRWLYDLRRWTWPRQCGAKGFIFDGREGWKRAFTGARVRSVSYEMDFLDG